jgi:predicted DNA-binding mobile mystery protein A
MLTKPNDLRLRQLAQRFPRSPLPDRPPLGWIRTIREALGISTTQFARRLDVAQKNVIALEQREARGTITLGSLERAAKALDCQLVYAIVPRDSLQAIRERQAKFIARRRLDRVSHTMALEDQSVSPEERAAQEEDLAAELLATWPRSFWDEAPSQ